jgi:uncharacterized protein YbjT (DUF2867 family)
MASRKLQILLTGATGYVGGSVLHKLLQHKENSLFSITVIVRDSEKAKLFEKVQAQTGVQVTAVQGSHSDEAVVAPLAAKSDVVITAADVDDLDAAKAVLKGLKKKYEDTGVRPILLQTVCFDEVSPDKLVHCQ